jgi:hypothetical protein
MEVLESLGWARQQTVHEWAADDHPQHRKTQLAATSYEWQVSVFPLLGTLFAAHVKG